MLINLTNLNYNNQPNILNSKNISSLVKLKHQRGQSLSTRMSKITLRKNNYKNLKTAMLRTWSKLLEEK